MQTLQALNPEYKHGTRLILTKGVYTLLVPVNKANAIRSELADKVIVT